MNNLFDSSNYPDTEPDKLVIGDFWAWTRSDITEVYPTATYTLKYEFSLLTSVGTVTTITADKVSSAHVVSVSNTTAYTAGRYKYRAIIVRDSDSAEITIEEGIIEFIADSGDIRSHARKVLDAIRAVIEGTASKEQASYTIAGRSISRRSIEELLTLRKEYEQLVKREEDEILRAQGKATKSRVLVQMKA